MLSKNIRSCCGDSYLGDSNQTRPTMQMTGRASCPRNSSVHLWDDVLGSFTHSFNKKISPGWIDEYISQIFFERLYRTILHSCYWGHIRWQVNRTDPSSHGVYNHRTTVSDFSCNFISSLKNAFNLFRVMDCFDHPLNMDKKRTKVIKFSIKSQRIHRPPPAVIQKSLT